MGVPRETAPRFNQVSGYRKRGHFQRYVNITPIVNISNQLKPVVSKILSSYLMKYAETVIYVYVFVFLSLT